MRQNSIWNVLFTLICLAAVVYIAYLAIDASDAARRQSARVEQSLNRLSDSLDQLGRSLSHMQAVANAAPGGQAATPAAMAGPRGHFVDDDLRDPMAEDGGSMVMRTSALPGNLNYMITGESMVGTIWRNVVDSLASTNSNDNTKYEPLMAESWERSDDGLVFTIRLRRNINWQPYTDPVTGANVAAKPVTARDFVFFWEIMQNLDIPAEALRTYYAQMESLEAVDDYTIKVVWKEPYSMAEAFTLGMQPLPEHYYRPDPDIDPKRFAEEFNSSTRNQWIVGTGPYRLAKWDKNTGVVMERDENYFGPKPAIQRIEYKLIPDDTVAFLEFQRDQLDVYGLKADQWHNETPAPRYQMVTPSIETAYEDSLAWDKLKKAGQVPGDYAFEKFQNNSPSWFYIGWNMLRPMFADRATRVALTHLVNRQRILEEVYMGLGKIITGPFVPHSPYYNHEIKPYPFDIEKAKELLAGAGWEDTDGDGILDKDYDGSGVRKPLSFSLIYTPANIYLRKMAGIVEQDMLQAGIQVNIKPLEWSVLGQVLENRAFDACALGWIGGVEGDPFQIWHGSGARRPNSSNHVGYDSPEANRLIEEGRRTVDKQARYAIYRRLHEVIHEDQPYTFLISPTSLTAENKRLYNAIVYKGGGMNPLLFWIPREMQATR